MIESVNNLDENTDLPVNIKAIWQARKLREVSFMAIKSMNKIKPVYNLGLETFMKQLDFKEDEEGEDQGSDDESVASSIKSYGSFRLSPDEHSVVQSLIKKIDLNMLERDLPIFALTVLITTAMMKKLISQEDTNKFFLQQKNISKSTEGSTIFELMQPCLTEAEAKVAVAILDGEKDGKESSLDILLQHQELNLLKILSEIKLTLELAGWWT